MAFYSKMIVIRAASVYLLLLLNLALICGSLSAAVKPVISRKIEENSEIINNRWSSPRKKSFHYII